MSNLVSIEGEPDEVRVRALSMAARMEGFESQVRSLVGDIKAREAGHHEGDDDIGQLFRNNGEGGGYEAPMPNGLPFNEYVHQAASGVGPRAVETASAIADAMTSFTFADQQAKDRISTIQVSHSAKLVDG